jgi:hypothetical protein
VVGLGGLESQYCLGGRFERIFKALPDMGDGLLGLQVGVDWYGWSDGYNYPGGSANSSVSIIPIGVTANYHFKMENKKIDPFVGAGLGYQIANADACAVYQGVRYCGGASYNSEIYFIVKGGIRYFMNQSTALYADVGATHTLNLGAMFKIKAVPDPSRFKGPALRQGVAPSWPPDILIQGARR